MTVQILVIAKFDGYQKPINRGDKLSKYTVKKKLFKKTNYFNTKSDKNSLTVPLESIVKVDSWILTFFKHPIKPFISDLPPPNKK